MASPLTPNSNAGLGQNTQVITVKDPVTGKATQQVVQNLVDPKTGKTVQVPGPNAVVDPKTGKPMMTRPPGGVQVVMVPDPVTGQMVQQMVQTVVDPKTGQVTQIPVQPGMAAPGLAGQAQQIITVTDPKTGKPVQQIVQTVVDPKTGKPTQVTTPLANQTQNGKTLLTMITN